MVNTILVTLPFTARQLSFAISPLIPSLVRSVQEAQDKGLTTGIHRTKGRGNRLLILHMVGPDGLIPECLRVWIRSNKTIQCEDYHNVSTTVKTEKL